jgi:hypothetical protein
MAYTGEESSALIRTQSLTRTKTQELIASHKERDINPQDDRWEGSIDQAADGSFLRRPRRRTTSPGQKVLEKDEWELADEVSSSREMETARRLMLTLGRLFQPQVRRYRAHLTDSGLPFRKLGLQWDHLNVRGKGAETVLKDTVVSQFEVIDKVRSAIHSKQEKVILQDNFGVVKPGEMLLVLARPGGGATTLLRMLSNHRKGYSAVEGDVRFGSMDAKRAKEFRAQIVMHNEEVRLRGFVYSVVAWACSGLMIRCFARAGSVLSHTDGGPDHRFCDRAQVTGSHCKKLQESRGVS